MPFFRISARASGFGRSTTLFMYLTYPLRLHSDRLAGLFTQFHVPRGGGKTARSVMFFASIA